MPSPGPPGMLSGCGERPRYRCKPSPKAWHPADFIFLLAVSLLRNKTGRPGQSRGERNRFVAQSDEQSGAHQVGGRPRIAALTVLAQPYIERAAQELSPVGLRPTGVKHFLGAPRRFFGHR